MINKPYFNKHVKHIENVFNIKRKSKYTLMWHKDYLLWDPEVQNGQSASAHVNRYPVRIYSLK